MVQPKSPRRALVITSFSPGDSATDPIEFEAVVPGELAVIGTLTDVDDRLVLTKLEITSHPDGGEVSASAVHRLQVAQIVADARKQIVAVGGFTWEGRDPDEIAVARRRAERAAGPLKRGRSGYGDEHYRRIAFAYLDLVDRGQTRGVLAALAAAETKSLGREVPVETVRTWVNQARRRGFLTPGEPGRAGAKPGPRLIEDNEGADR